VRGNPEQDRTFPEGLEHQAQLAMLEVSKAAVDEAARARAGARTEIGRVDEGRMEPPHRGVTQDPGAGDAAADHQEIELPRRQLSEPGAHRGHRPLSHVSGTSEVPAAATRPSTWFEWHSRLITRGTRVLDVGCGSGRHSLTAAAMGAEVTGVDVDTARLDLARKTAQDRGLTVTWVHWDLAGPLPPLGTFDVLLMFNYLDRGRLPALLGFLRPGGLLLMETFLTDQREFGWGPTSDEHLLRRGELPSLVAPLVPLHGREVIEPVGGVQWTAVASVLARKAN
jgi:2-polyprenyl-3-methyl-5-hydroxy-6-metoxy-1,4-benzoquinol methylase